MIPDRNRQVRVRANIAGDVELRVREGDQVLARQNLAVVEGDVQVESLNARSDATVVEIKVAQGATVAQGALLMILQEVDV